MAEIILREGESIDEALKRFKRAVGREGTVRSAKNIAKKGMQTPSQKRRLKGVAGRRRWRQILNKQAEAAYRNSDYGNDEVKANFWADDTAWAISDTAWKPDLTPIKRSSPEEIIAGPASFYHFGESKRIANSVEPPPPSTHVCGIGEMIKKRQRVVPIVRSFKEDGKTPRDKFTFPGGGVEKGETPVEALVREYMEEVGLAIEVICKIFETASESIEDGKHTFTCFLIRILGGTSHPGTEINKLLFMPLANLVKFQEETQGLSHNHALSLSEYRKKLEAGELPQVIKPTQVKKSKTRTKATKIASSTPRTNGKRRAHVSAS